MIYNEIFFLVVFVLLFIKSFRFKKENKKEREIAIDKGVKPIKFTLLNVAFTLYWLPMLLFAIFRSLIFSTTFYPLIVFCSYAPGIVLSFLIVEEIKNGYDYQRKASRKINEIQYVGWFGMIIFLALWIVAYFFLPTKMMTT